MLSEGLVDLNFPRGHDFRVSKICVETQEKGNHIEYYLPSPGTATKKDLKARFPYARFRRQDESTAIVTPIGHDENCCIPFLTVN
jgi:hypothetical protein